jgi:hypothetical protein
MRNLPRQMCTDIRLATRLGSLCGVMKLSAMETGSALATSINIAS